LAFQFFLHKQCVRNKETITAKLDLHLLWIYMSKLTHQASLISYFQYIFSHLIETHPCYRLWWLVKHKKNLPIPSVCTSAYYYINNNPNKSQKNLKESHTVSKIFRASRKESWRILVNLRLVFFLFQRISKESQRIALPRHTTDRCCIYATRQQKPEEKCPTEEQLLGQRKPMNEPYILLFY